MALRARNSPGCVLRCLHGGGEEVVERVPEEEPRDAHGGQYDGDPAEAEGAVDLAAQVLPPVQAGAAAEGLKGGPGGGAVAVLLAEIFINVRSKGAARFLFCSPRSMHCMNNSFPP